jgi:hypothetical protein
MLQHVRSISSERHHTFLAMFGPAADDPASQFAPKIDVEPWHIVPWPLFVFHILTTNKSWYVSALPRSIGSCALSAARLFLILAMPLACSVCIRWDHHSTLQPGKERGSIRLVRASLNHGK